VDGVIPIFSIYKKWQQREAANPRKDKQFTVMRPSEMFMSKITPLLKEHNIKPTDNRRGAYKYFPPPPLKEFLSHIFITYFLYFFLSIQYPI
jgi:serine/threonine-protein kinase SMG1